MSSFAISGEQLVKNLKNNHLNSQEKIELASKVFHNPESTSLPNVEEFLVEWVVQQLVKSIKLKEDLFLEAPFFNEQYWQLLIDVISCSNSSSSLSEHFLQATLTKQPFFPVISHLVNFISNSFFSEKGINEKKIENLLDLARISLERGSPHFGSVNQEWIIKLFLSSLSLIQTIADKKVGAGLLISSLKLLNVPALGMIPVFKWSNSYKKLFQILIDQLLYPIFNCKSILEENSLLKSFHETQALLKNLDEIVQVGLFHSSYVLDYSSYISSPKNSYRTVLFLQLKAWVLESSASSVILKSLPVLFNFFAFQIEEFAVTQLAFDIAWEFIQIIMILPINSSTLRSISEILETLHEKNIYTPTNDPISKSQLTRLEEVCSFLQRSGDLNNSALRPFIFQCYRALVTIDYVLIDSYSSTLWNMIVYPSCPEKEEAAKLSLALIHEYSQARQWNSCFKSLVDSFDSSNKHDLVLYLPLFADGLHKILSQISSKTQALEIFHIVATAIITPSEKIHPNTNKKLRVVKTSNIHGCCCLLSHLVCGIPSSLLPYSSVKEHIQDVFEQLFRTLFPDDLELVSEQEKFIFSLEKNQNIFKKAALDLNCVAALNLFSNVLDRWKEVQFLDPWLASIYSWSSSQSFSQGPAFESWEIPVMRLSLQSLESATFPKGTEQTNADLSFNRLETPISIIKHSNPLLLKALWQIVLGPWFPLIGELANNSQKQLLSRFLIQSFIAIDIPEKSLSGLGNLVLSTSRFFEISSLRSTFLSTLFEMLAKCLLGDIENLGTWDSHITNPSDESLLLDILDDFFGKHILPIYSENNILLIEKFHELLLIVTHLPANYLSSFNKLQMTKVLYLHQKLLVHLLGVNCNQPDYYSSLQVGWKINLSIIGTILNQSAIFIFQDCNYVFWLIEKVTEVIDGGSTINKLSAIDSQFFFDILVHIISTTFNQQISNLSSKKPSSDSQNSELVLFSRFFNLNNNLCEMSISSLKMIEIAFQVFENLKGKQKNLIKLGEIFEKDLESPAERWPKIVDNIAVCLNLTYENTSLIRATIAQVLLYTEIVNIDSDFRLSLPQQDSLYSLVAFIHSITNDNLLKLQSFDYKFLIDHAVRIESNLLLAFPLNFLPIQKLLPCLTGFLLAIDKSVLFSSIMGYSLSVSDNSTFLLQKTLSNFLSRLDQIQWDDMFNIVSSRLFKHIDHPVRSQSSLLFIQLCCIEYNETYKHLTAKKADTIISCLIRLLQLTYDQVIEPLRFQSLSLVQTFLLRSDCKVSSSIFSLLLVALSKLSIGEKSSEILIGNILSQIMISHSSVLENCLPIFIRSLVRLSSSPKSVLIETLRNLRHLKKQPGIVMYVQNLLVQLVKHNSPPVSWYFCFDALYPQSPEAVLQWLDENDQFQFKQAYQKYLAHHKYSGKV